MWPKVTVVIPAFNEELVLRRKIENALAIDYPKDRLEILVASDGSTDRTETLACAAGAEVVRLPINLGVGGALRAGFRYAVQHGYDCVVQVDADGQHIAEHIAELLAALDDKDLDMVIGSRFAGK